jgi:pimeloyl-ACP methyl ester carboxylesterase
MTTLTHPDVRRRAVDVYNGPEVLAGELAVPPDARAVVVFAHGSGSSRNSPRNTFVAGELNAGGFATLLLDLLTPEEQRIDLQTGEFRFDVDFLASRLSGATEWLEREEDLLHLPVMYFGASTGAAAALAATAHRPEIAAVVSRGGRPDLAGTALPLVRAPTLLIVGGEDEAVLRLNQQAITHLRCEKQLVVMPGATHLFEEAGALARVARLARKWLHDHLPHAAPEMSGPGHLTGPAQFGGGP